MKNFLTIIALIVALGLGIWAGKLLGGEGWFEMNKQEQSTVLLQEVKDVMKLVTVEGYFSEVYDYKDYWFTDWKAFTKKALIRVKAKVSIGYDLEAMTFDVDESNRTIRITGLPQPEIISIDHDLDYYDLQQGSFNSFSIEDYNMLNTRAKKFIESQVEESELFDRAQSQLVDVQRIITHLVEAQGFTVSFQSETPLD